MKEYANELLKKGVKYAIFDVDNTITKSNIVEFYIYMKSTQIKNKFMYLLWLVYFIIFIIPVYLIIDNMNRGLFGRVFSKRLSKFKYVDLEKCAKEFFNSRLTNKFIKEIHDMVLYFRDNGISVILLSGTIDSLIKNYAEYFEVPYESIKVNNNDGYVKVDYSNFDNHKLDFVKKFNPEETVTIADSRHDLEILKYSKYSIVVANKRIKPWMQQLENAHIIQIK